MLKISGVYSAALTPIKEDLTVNKDLYLRHCQYLMKQGHDGLAIFGTTGEANSFSIKEKCETPHSAPACSWHGGGSALCAFIYIYIYIYINIYI